MISSITTQELVVSNKQKKQDIKETLFPRIAENDPLAFEELVRMTERSLYAFTLSLLKNHEDAVDTVQDTYLKIRAAAHLYRPMGKPMAWIFTIARNLSMGRLRSQTRASHVPLEEMENDLSFSYLTDKDDRLVLQAALEILSQQEREIILLHAISGLSHREIAQNLGMPLATALSKYHRGLKKLRKYLEEQGVPR